MNFFAKMAADLDSHPKIRRCGKDRRAAREIFLFVLRRIAGEQAQGAIAIKNVEPWYLEDQLDIPEDEAARGLAACARVELLELTDDEVVVVGWDDEWAKRPLTEAERQQRRREKKKAAASHEASRDVTDVTSDHGSHGSEETRREDTEKKEDQNPEARTPRARDLPVAGGVAGLLHHTYRRVAEARLAIADELGLPRPVPMPPSDTPAQPIGVRDLRERLRAEGEVAEQASSAIVDNAIAHARKSRSVEWLSEKLFTEGGWRTARNWSPSGGAPRAGPRLVRSFSDVAVDELERLEREQEAR